EDLAQHLCRSAFNRLRFCRIVHRKIARVVSLCSTPSATLRCLGSDDSGRESTGHAPGPGGHAADPPAQRMNPKTFGCAARVQSTSCSWPRFTIPEDLDARRREIEPA